ncbi:MAG: class I adenylate-forming enzyme family protein [Pseudomonadota bacterium]
MVGRNLSSVIDPNAPRERNAIVMIGEQGAERVLSYDALNEEINAVANGLLARGVSKGARIGILADNRAEHFIAYMGVMRAGFVAVPINQKLKAAGVRHILNDAEVDLVFADEQNKGFLAPETRIIDFDVGGEDGYGALLKPGPLSPFAPSQTDLAVIMYTSGSSGRPKGVPITHAGYLWAIEQFDFLRESLEGRSALISAPLFHMNAQFHIQSVLYVGGTAVLTSRFQAQEYLRAIETFKVARATGVPTMFALAAQAQEAGLGADLSSVTSVAMGSAPVTRALVDRTAALFPNAMISNGYGTTEVGPAIFGLHPEGRPAPVLSLGYPMADVEVRLVGTGAPNEGVLHVRSKMVTRGYLNLPTETARKISDGWYDTGDVMRRDAEGFYFFVSRADDMFVCGGENIYPGEVEKLLETHPFIDQAAVVPVEDDIKGALPMAFIVAAPGSSLTEEDVKHYTLENGPAYAHPRFIVFMEALPLSGVNKIDKKQLTENAKTFQRPRP